MSIAWKEQSLEGAADVDMSAAVPAMNARQQRLDLRPVFLRMQVPSAP